MADERMLKYCCLVLSSYNLSEKKFPFLFFCLKARSYTQWPCCHIDASSSEKESRLQFLEAKSRPKRPVDLYSTVIGMRFD